MPVTIVENTEEADFTIFITDPTVPYDFTLTNGVYAFECHKNVLMKISTVLRDIIEGDQENTKISLTDVNDDAMKLLEELIYTKPKDRKNVDFMPDYTSTILSVFTLSSKYSILIMKHFVENWISGRGVSDGEAFEIIYQDALDKGLDKLASDLKVGTFKEASRFSYDDLSSFSNKTILELINQTALHSQPAKFTAHLIRYAFEHEDSAIKQAIKEKTMTCTKKFHHKVLELLLDFEKSCFTN